MPTVTRKVYLTNAKDLIKYNFPDWYSPNFSINFSAEEKVPEGYVYLATIEFQHPEINKDFCTPAAIHDIDSEIERTRAEAGRRITELEAERAKILSIEYDDPSSSKSSSDLDEIIEDAVEIAVPQARDKIIDDGFDDPFPF